MNATTALKPMTYTIVGYRNGWFTLIYCDVTGKQHTQKIQSHDFIQELEAEGYKFVR